MSKRTLGTVLMVLGIVTLVTALLLFIFVDTVMIGIAFIASIALNASGVFLLTSGDG